MLVNRVFHNWLLALLQVDAVIAGDGELPAFAALRCGELGTGPINNKITLKFTFNHSNYE